MDAPCQPFICAEDLPVSGWCVDLLSVEQVNELIDEASLLLYLMSHRRVYGVCSDVVTFRRTWRESCTHPHLRFGQPIRRVRWVRIGDDYVEPGEYRVLERVLLERIGDVWPDDTDIDVYVEHGSPIDAITKRAAIDTVVELGKMADTVPPRRKLASNATSAHGSGVSVTMRDRGEMIRELGSTLESVARFMAVHNPRATPPTYIHSPDL